jgi:hypothetical protein
MKRIWFILSITSFAMIGMSCSALKNMGGTLSKSDSVEAKEENLEQQTNSSEQGGRVDYTKMKTFAQLESEGQGNSVTEKDTLISAKASQNSMVDTSATREEKSMRSIARTERAEFKPEQKSLDSTFNNTKEVLRNESGKHEGIGIRVAQQYEEMDRLAEVVLYELKIVERRYDKLIAQYKTASNADRNRISAELDRLSADQIKLYRMYVKVYKEGKSNWIKTKSDVEDGLYLLRGISNE